MSFSELFVCCVCFFTEDLSAMVVYLMWYLHLFLPANNTLFSVPLCLASGSTLFGKRRQFPFIMRLNTATVTIKTHIFPKKNSGSALSSLREWNWTFENRLHHSRHSIRSFWRRMYSAIQDMIYQHVRFRFARADDHKEELKAVISKNFASAEHLDVESTSAAIQQIYQNASQEVYLCTRDMFKAAFVFMLSNYWYEQLALDLEGLVEAYPDFCELDERELELLLFFRNMLRVSMLIFDPHASKDDFMSMLCGVCGVTESFLISQPHMPARFLEVFEHEIVIPHAQPQPPCAIPLTTSEMLLLGEIQQQWDEDDQSELLNSNAASSFWHHHCLLTLTGRDIPCIVVPAMQAGFAHTSPPHDLDWATPLPEQTALTHLTNRTPSPPTAGDYYTNYAAQLVQFTQRQTAVYQSGYMPTVEPMIQVVSQHTTPQHAQQSERSNSTGTKPESPATSPKT